METPAKPVHTGAKEVVDGPRTVSPSHGIGISGDSALKTPSTQQSDPASQPQTSSSFSFSSSIGLMSKRWNPASSFSTPSTLDRRIDDTPRYGFRCVHALTKPNSHPSDLSNALHPASQPRLQHLFFLPPNHMCACHFLSRAKRSSCRMNPRLRGCSLRDCSQTCQVCRESSLVLSNVVTVRFRV